MHRPNQLPRKSVQSRRAKEIFGRPEGCLVWLGDVYDEPSSWEFSLAHLSLDQLSKASSGIAISNRDAHSACSLVTAFEGLRKQKEGASAERLRPFVTSERQKKTGLTPI